MRRFLLNPNPMRAIVSRLRRFPSPAAHAAVQAMCRHQWATIADRTPTYLEAYVDKPGSDDRAQRRAEWLAGQDVFGDAYSVLELGCGAGRNLAALRRRWALTRLYGVDINAQACAAAREAVPDATITEMDLYALDPTQPGAFDVLFTCGVLGHIEPAALPGLLATMLKIARKAVVLCEEPGHGEVAKGPRSWGAEKATDDYLHWRHPLLEMLLRAGARRVEVSTVPAELQAPAATRLFVVPR